MKKISKIFSIFTIALMLICICTNVFAVSINIDDITGAASIDSDAADAMEKFGGTVIGYVTNAAMVVAVVMIAVLGIKYMMGSAEEKSEYKKSMLPLLVGAILVFGAATVAKVIVGLAASFS